MKKLLIGLLAVLSTLCVFSACDSEDAPPATSNLSMEGGFWYSFEEDAYTITGYEGTDTDVVILNTYNGYPITSIGDWAFEGCSSLMSVTFVNPNGWWVTQDSTATSGTSIASSDLSNPATAAEYLTSTYYYYYWKRS